MIRLLIITLILVLFLTPQIASARERDNLQGFLFIESIGLFRPIIQVPLTDRTYDLTGLHWRVGHPDGTAWVNEPGNLVLLGHNGAAFIDLDKLSPGDIIIVDTEKVTVTYEINTKFFVHKEQWEVMATPVDGYDKSTITLLTCVDFDEDWRLAVLGTMTQIRIRP